MPAMTAPTTQLLLVDQLNQEWHNLSSTMPLPRQITAISHLDGCATLDDVLIRLRTLEASPADEDQALLALLELHITGDCHTAGRLVLQRMLGRVVNLAQRAYRRQAHADIDSLMTMAVAALWDAIATYPLARRPRRVGANLAMEALARFTRWCRSDDELADPHEDMTEYAAATVDEVDAGIELLQTLAWGVERDVISKADAALLVRVYCPPAGAPTAPDTVAAELGLARGTIRQRCRRAIHRLARAAADAQ